MDIVIKKVNLFMENSLLKEYRCACGKLLFKGFLANAVIEIKCKRCEKVNLFEKNILQKATAPFELKIQEAGSAKDG